MDFSERIRDLLVGKTIIDVYPYKDNEHLDGTMDGTGIQLLLDDGSKVNIGINYDDVDLYVQEHDEI